MNICYDSTIYRSRISFHIAQADSHDEEGNPATGEQVEEAHENAMDLEGDEEFLANDEDLPNLEYMFVEMHIPKGLIADDWVEFMMSEPDSVGLIGMMARLVLVLGLLLFALVKPQDITKLDKKSNQIALERLLQYMRKRLLKRDARYDGNISPRN